ncbi:hypothetical protein FRC06_000300, partial [Ceratobasidium sp. 370]
PRSRTVPDDWFDKLQDERIESDSWVAEPKQHSQRQKRVDANGKRIVSRTRIEELRTCDKTDAYIKEHDHWFGCRFKFNFNPYSKDKSLLSKSHRLVFPRPWPQAGCDKNNLQYAIGLKDNCDQYNDIRHDVRHACATYGLSSPGATSNWLSVLSKRHANLQTAMLRKYPFLSHFCDKDGDSWAVKMMAQTFLGGQKSQQTSTPTAPLPYNRRLPGNIPGQAGKEHATHKRHHCQPDRNTEEQPGSEGSPEPPPPNNNNDLPCPALSGKAAADRRKAAKVQTHKRDRAQCIKDTEEAAKATTKDQAASKATKSRSLKSTRGKKPLAMNDDNDAGHPPAFHRDPLQESEAGPLKDAGQLKEGLKEAKTLSDSPGVSGGTAGGAASSTTRITRAGKKFAVQPIDAGEE